MCGTSMTAQQFQLTFGMPTFHIKVPGNETHLQCEKLSGNSTLRHSSSAQAASRKGAPGF